MHLWAGEGEIQLQGGRSLTTMGYHKDFYNGFTVDTMRPGRVPALKTRDAAIKQYEHSPAWQTRNTTSPQEIAKGVAFLCSDSGRFSSGAILPFMHR